MVSIDLNADLGEATAGNAVSDDTAMIELISSANVACGFHAGEPVGIARTIAAAAQANVTIGAHPGYRDIPGFGRRFIDYNPAELREELLYQIGAIHTLARVNGRGVSYVKPHGALYNAIVHHEAQAEVVVDSVKKFNRTFDLDVPLLLLPGSIAIDIADAAGVRVVREAFADRNYNPDGTLVSRRLPNAVLHDPKLVADRVVELAKTGTLTASDGTQIKVQADSICVHGDSPGAVDMTRSITEALKAAGIEKRSFAS
ncbi:LamB/YcsF family protein [Corynebacterium ulceribovis]|uniref:LamB/YcsF family protein n=1 Tax=Corynebacterium ulceribovis TaxID=487732 RepID=UPI00037DAD9B|nr:5-oxoprolinase subunit PxpA [Corynebacterium ulceribovis]